MMSDDNHHDDISSIPIPHPDQDYYTVLGVGQHATDKAISNAHKKLSLKYHPDRNPDDDEAKATFQLVSVAYQTLIDPEKRKEYDHQLSNTKQTVSEEVPHEDLSHDTGDWTQTIKPMFGLEIGKALTNAMNRLNIKPSTLNPDIVEAAQIISKNDLDGGGPPLDPRVSDLPFGWPSETKVDRQVCAYYRITVDESHINNGFFIRCKSNNKGKFRLFILNKEGKMVAQEESRKGLYDTNYTEVVLFYTSFPTYEFVDPSLVNAAIVSSGSPAPEELITDFSSSVAVSDPFPTLQEKLKGFVHLKRTIHPGQYLICVYGDNVLGKTNIHISIAASNNQLSEASEIQTVDKSLLEGKESLEKLRNDYLQAKLAFNLAAKKVETEADHVASLIASRERSYRQFLDKSASVYAPTDPTLTPSVFASFSAVATTTILSAGTVAASVITAAAANLPSGQASNESEQEDKQKDSSLESDQSFSPTNSMNFLINNSKVAASTASAAGGWFMKNLSAVRLSISKAAEGLKVETSDSPSHASVDSFTIESPQKSVAVTQPAVEPFVEQSSPVKPIHTIESPKHSEDDEEEGEGSEGYNSVEEV